LVRFKPVRDAAGRIVKWLGLANDIHEIKGFEECVRQHRDIFRSIVESMPALIFAVDRDLRLTLANEALAHRFGLSAADLIGKTVDDVFPGDLANRVNAVNGQVLASTHAQSVEEVITSKTDATARTMTMTTFPLRDAAGSVIGLAGVAHDITEHKQAQEALRIAATAFESQEGTVVADADFRIVKVNRAFTQITGYEEFEVLGASPAILNAHAHDERFHASLWEQIRRTGSWQGELKNRRKNGQIYPQHLTITAVKDGAGRVVNYVLNLSDISLRKAAEREIQRLVYYDPLTGLPNRRFLSQRFARGFALGSRSRQQGALLFIDLDQFKVLNDTLGHAVGDALLQQVAHRLQACVREGDVVARLGGDEFLVILIDLGPEPLEAGTRAEAIGEKILAALQQPYSLASHRQHCSASIGITMFRENQAEFDELLKQADISMYQAKHEGRNRLRFFDQRMQEAVMSRAALERDLREAIEHHQFELHYQIQVDDRRRPYGAEVLVRWRHPRRGLVSPTQFIRLAEETGLILPLGEWVLASACAQLAAWRGALATRSLKLSVNVSGRQFRQPGFVGRVSDTLRLYQVDTQQLRLELTESVLLENIEEAGKTMDQLRALGVRFSLDDFGTGYSSLRYLKKLPIDELKIDQSFIHDIAVDAQDRAIVRTIIAMATHLGLSCIAEGVEQEADLALLLEDGCHYFQGHYFGAAQPLAEFEASLATF